MASPARVMLVDDDPSARFLMRTVLGDHPADFEVVAEAGSAHEALAQLAAAAPDAVLLDARMPGEDGYELAGRLLAERPAVRLVLLSALVDEAVRDRAAAAGIHACLDKGEFDAVAGVLREVLSPAPGGSAAPA